MKASAVVATLGIADSTVRKYADQYAVYLSPSGTGGGGKHRDYTDHDLRVLKLIRDMKFANTDPDNIEVTLQSLQLDGWERLPPLDGDTRAIIQTPATALAASVDKSAMQREIELLREMLDRAEERAHRAVAEATADRDELLHRLHRAELRLELYESGELKPRGN